MSAKVTIISATVESEIDREVKTKAQVWGCWGLDPYPDKAMDEPVLEIVYHKKHTLTAEVLGDAKLGDVIEAGGQNYYIISCIAHYPGNRKNIKAVCHETPTH